MKTLKLRFREAVLVKGTWTCQKRARGTPEVGWRKKANRRSAPLSGNADMSRAHVVVGECALYKEERSVLDEEMRKKGMEKFGALQSRL